MRRAVCTLFATVAAAEAEVSDTVQLSLQYAGATGVWERYAEVELANAELRRLRRSSISTVVTQIPDKSEKRFCSELWESLSADETRLYFRVLNADLQHLGTSSCDLTAVKNWQQFCRLLSNMEFVAEYDESGRVNNVLALPPSTHAQRDLQMSFKRLGFVSVLKAAEPLYMEETEVPHVLEPDPRAPVQEAKGNWWWGFLIAMVAVQVVSVLMSKEDAPARSR